VCTLIAGGSEDNVSKRLFATDDLRSFLETRKSQLAQEVQQLGRDYLLTVSETDLVMHLVDKYQLEPPALKRDDVVIADHRETEVDVRGDFSRLVFDRSRPALVKGTSVTVAIPYTGSIELFIYKPSTFTFSGTPEAALMDGELRLTYAVLDHNEAQLKDRYERELRDIEQYLGWVRGDVQQYVATLQPYVEQVIHERKRRLLADAGLAASLGIPLPRRPGDTGTYSPPEVRRKLRIPSPEVPRGQFKPEPSLPDEDYEHILSVLEKTSAVMERSPQAFEAIGEEDIRWHFVLQLNGHFEQPATGETFNGSGKTDILLPYESGHLFIAECKFWKGRKMLLDTLSQMLGYVTWRDTKAALLIFNRNQDHTAVIEKIIETVPQHSCYKRELACRGETHLRYAFHQPGDLNRDVQVAVLVFDIPRRH
jgi:hypothetical protein